MGVFSVPCVRSVMRWARGGRGSRLISPKGYDAARGGVVRLTMAPRGTAPNLPDMWASSCHVGTGMALFGAAPNDHGAFWDGVVMQSMEPSGAAPRKKVRFVNSFRNQVISC